MLFENFELIRKYRVGQLDEVLEFYKKGGVKVPELENKEQKLTYIKELVDTIGIPHIITEEDLEANNGMEVGDVIIVSGVEVEEVPKEEQIDESEIPQPKNRPEPKEEKSGGRTEEEMTIEVEELVKKGYVKYNGKTVIGWRPVTSYGVVRFELDCNTERYTISRLEFNSLIAEVQGLKI